MKILLYSLNYAPELTGIGKYTAEQAEWLAARGHEVRVVTAPPYYPAWRIGHGYRALQYRRERLNGVEILRAPLWVPAKPSGARRLVHLASFALSSLPHLVAQLRWKPDVLFLVEPPLMCAPAALVFAQWSVGCKTWLHVQDYEVDAAFALGLLKRSWLRRLATRFESLVMRHFDYVSTISEAMLRLARQKGARPDASMLLPNWVDVREIRPGLGAPCRERLGIPPDAVVALYSGNMGHKQGLHLLADAARRLAAREDIEFIFCGAGAGRAALQAACLDLPRVRFLPLQSAEDFPALLGAADIHLLPQRADAADLVLPSKLAGMLASGRPVIATAHPDTELGQLLDHCGIVVPPGDSGALADAIVALAADPARRAAIGAAGRAWAEQNLDRQVVMETLERALLALCESPRHATVPAVEARGK